MTTHFAPVDPMVQDAFTEICNIGTGRAASALSDMIDRKITIDVPRIEYFTIQQGSPFKDLENLLTVQVSQSFSSAISGKAILLLSKQGAVKLGQLLMGELDAGDAFGDSEQGAMLELGNIMIGSLIGSISNALDLACDYGLPDIQLKGADSLSDFSSDASDFFIIVRARLHIDAEDIQSYLILVLHPDQFDNLILRIHQLVEDS